MQNSFTELVIAGSFACVKGFLLGFRCGSGKQFSYFFHRKHGIRRDTLAEMVKEVLELDNYVHLCLEDGIVQDFKQAVEKAKPVIGLEIERERRIKEAHFQFSFSIKNLESAKRVKEIFSSLPSGVNLEGYQPREEILPEGGTSTGGYAPFHTYVFKGDGTVRGDFGGVMELFLKVKRSPDSDLVLLSDIMLDFDQ